MSGEPIAVVGLACRYPDAVSPDELWRTVLAGRRGFRRLPEERLGAGYRGESVDTTPVSRAGLLRDWEFDRARFGVPGPLHRAVDHTHWLALETAADVLGDCGADPTGGEGLPVHRDRIGVVLGNSLTGEFSRAALLRARLPFIRSACDLAMARRGAGPQLRGDVLDELEQLVHATFARPGDESLAGALSNTIAGRICNHFDFHGTGYTVDGACSSSLLAVMTACRALRDGELDLALAGGVDLSLDPLELVGFARLGALASGRMRIYDRDPTGFLPGEGCGMIALARVSDAERVGLPVRAEILGWGTSSDGAGGLTRPEASGQLLALRRAHAMAGLDPQDVGLVEGHGTGTAVGDRVELEAHWALRGRGGRPAVLGSVKANIGHTKAAAGIAGLVKAVLAVERGVLPPTTGCDRPHALLTEAGAPVRVPATAAPWTDRKRVAGVSSMGFGGINTHVLVGAAGGAGTVPLPAPALARWSRRAPEYDLVVLAAADRAALATSLDALAVQAARLSDAELHDLAATTRAHDAGSGPVRAALVVTGPDDLERACRVARNLATTVHAPISVDAAAGVAVGSGPPARVGLLFPGQAAPVRRQLPDWAADLPVPELAGGPAGPDGDVATQVAQPAIVRQSLAGLAWLDVLGCRPVAAAGHSLGELTALVWAGAMTPGDGLALAVVRGRVMAAYGRPGTGMASLATGAQHAERLVAGTGAVIAGINGTRQVTVAGPVADLRAVLARAAGQDVAGTLLPVSHGFHSPAMEPVTGPWRDALRDCALGLPTRPVVSTITGRLVDTDRAPAELLVEQLTAPVRFLDAARFLARRCDLLVEVGPGAILAGLVAGCDLDLPVVALDCGGNPRGHPLVTAALVAAGSADPAPFHAGLPYRPLLPGQPITLLASPCEQLAAPPTVLLPVGRPPVSDTGSGTQPGVRPAGATDGAENTDPLDVLRRHLARTLELPLPSIRTDADLLGELHLTSLQVVQIAVEVARVLGRAPGLPPDSLAGATVGELAELISGLPQAGCGNTSGGRGVRPVVHAFGHGWIPVAPPAPARPVAWQVLAPAEHWLATLAHTGPGAGLAVLLTGPGDAEGVAGLLARIGAADPPRLLVVHHGSPAAAGLARSAAAELPGCAVTVVQVPEEPADPETVTALITDLVTATGYREVRITGEGAVLQARSAPIALAGGGPLPLGAGEVVLVSGGLGGITADAVSVLAGRAGASMVVLGRSAPDSSRVVDGLAAFGPRCDVHYLQCDVTDPDEVAAAVAAAGRIGPVAGVVHGAGLNEPRRMSEVDATSLRRTLAPKVDGLAHLLAAVERPRFVVAFGSIIGRCGLPGQPEYAVANDWMRVELESWATAHPDTRCHLLEWSVWGGLGMGVALGVIEGLAATGVAPIDPELGREALLAVLTDPDAPVTLLLTGHFPATSTLLVEPSPPVTALRFAEQRHDLLPGADIILDAELSLGADPYLDDHRIDGTAVLPAVLGLEAMAQAAFALRGARSGWSVRDVRFDAPVLVPDHDTRTVQVAALAAPHDPGVVELALRDDADHFAADRFSGVVEDPPAPPEPAAGRPPLPPTAEAHPYYGPVLFHRGRFRRLRGYEWLSTSGVRAWIDAADPAVAGSGWFSDFHGDELLLGDPGAHDAAIHALLPCVPHRTALPVAVDRFTLWRAPAGPLQVTAVERGRGVREYVYDVDLHDVDGRAVARWDGLRLRAVGPARTGPPLDPALVGPLLGRRLIETGLARDVDLVVAPPGTTPADLCTRAPYPQTISMTACDAAPGVLAAFAGRPTTVWWDRLAPDGTTEGADPQQVGLAEKVAADTGESLPHALARVGAALRVLGELPDGTPPVLDRSTDDGLVVFAAADLAAMTAVVDVVAGGAVLVAVSAAGGTR